MSTYTKLADTLSGNNGTGYITRNGQNRPLFELSKLDAHITLKVTEKQLLGHRMTQHKVVGATGEGSGTFYFMNSEALKEFLEYRRSGQYRGVTLQVSNIDPQSTIGRQTVALYNVILKNIPVASIDAGSDDPITFDSDFTFDDMDCLEAFVLPENYR